MGIWYFLSYLDIFFSGLWWGQNLGSWVRPDSFAHLAAIEIVELQIHNKLNLKTIFFIKRFSDMLLVVPFFCRNFNGFFKIVNISSFAIKCYIGQGHIDYLLIDDIEAGLILKDPGEH